MNQLLQQAARNLYEAVIRFADECQELGGGVPSCAFVGTFGPEVDQLRELFPGQRLPEPGQSLWRRIRAMIDEDVSGRSEPSVECSDVDRLHDLLSRFEIWLRAHFELDAPTPDQTESGTCPGSHTHGATKSDAKQIRGKQNRLYLLYTALYQRHVDDLEGKQFIAFEQKELQKKLKWKNQSQISYYMGKLFQVQKPMKPMKAYKDACDHYRIGDFLKLRRFADFRDGDVE